MVNNSSKSKTSQDFSQTFTETLIGANYTKGKNRRPNKRYFATYPETILYDKDLSDNAKLIYGVISRYTGEKEGKDAFIGREKIAEKLGKSVSTVKRGIAELEDRGLAIRTEKGRKKGKGGRSVTLTTLKERLHENELEDFFFQPYPPEFYQRIAENESVFKIEDGVVKAKLDMTLEDWDRDLWVKYDPQPSHLRVKYDPQPSDDKDPRAQGKQGDLGGPSREVKEVSREVNNSGLRSSDLFATATFSQLKNKQTTNYNTNELIATLQLHALGADVVFKANKLRSDHRDKVWGQMSDLCKNLGGPQSVIDFFKWYFKDPRRIEKFRDIKRKFKVGLIEEKLDDYESYLLTKRKKREKARWSRREHLRITLSAPTTPYSMEDLASLNLEELEEIERELSKSGEDRDIEGLRTKIGTS